MSVKKWLFQNNIWGEAKYNEIINLVQKYEIPHQIATVIPFTNDFQEPVDINEIDMYFGSIKMSEIMDKLGFKGYSNPNFDWNVWSNIFKNHCLNYESVICDKLGNIDFPLEFDAFIRPVLDNKSFTGQVLPANSPVTKIQFGNLKHKNKNEIEVIIAPVQKIISEYRFFVVDGEIITGSLYRHGGKVYYKEVTHETEVLEFAEKMIGIWQPSQMFVIDIAVVPKGLKIIEFGSIHNCGFYDINLSKLIQAIYNFLNKN